MSKIAAVHNLTAERARRGRLPWTFTIDVAAGQFRIEVYEGAGRLDALAMADAAEAVARTLRQAARALRKGMIATPAASPASDEGGRDG